MIDWLTCIIKIDHNPINGGRLISFDENGVELFNVKKSARIEGSYSTSVRVKSQGALTSGGLATELFIDGNPSKLLQGHNIFGSLDIKELMHGLLLHFSNNNLITFNFHDACAALDSARVVRIDITHSLRFDSRLHVRAYIKQLSQVAHTRTGRPMQKQWTLAFNPNSQRWNLIVYSKGDEVSKRKAHVDFPHTEYIQSEADRLCRIELRLRSKELIELKLNTIGALTPQTLTELYADYLGRVKMNESIEATSDQLSKIPKVIRHTYLCWKSGIAIQSEMSEPTFYRHRKILLTIGVDISTPYTDVAAKNVVPLTKVITGEPYKIPQEAINKGLLYQFKQPQLTAVN
jgi:II/X family phage/plasmid replication protein